LAPCATHPLPFPFFSFVISTPSLLLSFRFNPAPINQYARAMVFIYVIGFDVAGMVPFVAVCHFLISCSKSFALYLSLRGS
jgi:hypothetical protein